MKKSMKMFRNIVSGMIHQQPAFTLLPLRGILSAPNLQILSYLSYSSNNRRNNAHEHINGITSQDVFEEPSFEEMRASADLVFKNVNCHIADDPGRLFAIIQILGKQYRVVNNDIILIERNWAPTINDKLIFEKVLLLGGSSFTLIGKPLLPKNLVHISGTIVHKDLTHTKMRFYHIPKKRVHNLNFVKEELTYIRINEVTAFPKVNVLEDATYSRC